MIRKFILFSILYGLGTQVYSQTDQQLDITELRSGALNYAFASFEAYDQFFRTGENSFLIEAVSNASKSNILFDYYVDIMGVPSDSDLIITVRNISELSNEYPKDLITIPAGTFSVRENEVSAESDYTARVIMAGMTTIFILERSLEKWVEDGFPN